MKEKNLAVDIKLAPEELENSFHRSEMPASYTKLKLSTAVYGKKQKRNRMAKKSRAINRRK